MRQGRKGAPAIDSTDAVQTSFVDALPRLAQLATEVVSLDPRQLRRALARIDSGSGETAAKIVVLMDEVESAFATIRRKLSSSRRLRTARRLQRAQPLR